MKSSLSSFVVLLLLAGISAQGDRFASSGSRDREYSVAGIRGGSTRGDTAGSSVNVCRRCEYLGVTYEGNSPFSFERGCWEYNCYCNCNGGFDCPSSRSRYTCTGSEECIRCDVTAYNGSYEEPNTVFELQRGCALYKNCRCQCDGGWSCDEGVYTCDIDSGCEVDGRRYATGQKFELTRGCDKLTDCTCSEGGVWTCNQATDICGKCRKCKIGDKYYDGDTQSFPASTNCTSYGSCDCSCDGTYSCQGGINTCKGERNQLTDPSCPDCRIDDVTYRNGESFDYESSCSNHSACQCRCGTVACREVTETCGDCRTCSVNGKTYQAGTEFEHKQGCYVYKQCQCSCDGRWQCYGNNAIDTCNTCKKCSIDGNQYDAYSKFNVDRKCWNYQCFCLCNGTTWCPSATVVNTCTQPDRCRTCKVNNQSFRGNSHFKYDLNGMELHCRCNCDGSYVCIAEWLYIRTDVSISGSGFASSGLVISSTGSGSGCFSCVMDGRSYKGDTKYRITRSGITLDCQCSCDGSYVCYGESRSEYQGCLGCNVGGLSYNGDTNFTTVYRGMKLDCLCSCNGSYICTGSFSESLEVYTVQCLSYGLLGCLPVTTGIRCANNGMFYNAGDAFLFQYERTNVNCLCGIDGSFFCESMTGLILSCVGGSCSRIGCQRCMVNGQFYGYNSQFPYRHNNINMLCTCRCDGSSYCVGIGSSINATCVNGECSQIGCGTCQYCESQFSGGSSFNLIHRGMYMECSCQCDSSYRCVSTSGDAVFQCNRGETCGPQRCKKCRVDGRRYKGLSVVTSSFQGNAVSCTCGCDGSYHCVGVSIDIKLSCLKGKPCEIIGGCRSCDVNGVEYQYGSQYEITSGNQRQQCRCQCDGTSECSIIEPPKPICSSCNINGVIYRGHSRSRITRGSDNFICDCFCNGTHVCEAERPVCNQCYVGGSMYKGDTTFQASIENIVMDCSCDCQGNYECISEYKICTPIGCRSTCQYCSIDGQSFAGKPGYRFDAHVFGLDMQCECKCDGSYHCACPTRICTSTSGCLDNCRNCIIDNKPYRENSNFQADVFGYRMQCSCECDGSYRCDSSSQTCTQLGCINKCRNCIIDNKPYRENSNFLADVFGYRMQCSCECNGNYRCESNTQTCTNSGCVDKCRNCLIDGRQFSRSQNFQADVFSYRMQCSCECSGSFRCESSTQTCTNSGCVDKCRRCFIDDRQFSRSLNFEADVFGYRMRCSCQCDGSFRCESSSQTCTNSGCVDNCRQCLIDGRQYSKSSNFQADVFGYRMQCTCECNGSYRCESDTRICTTSSGCVSRCQECNIQGTTYNGNTNFNAILEGINMDCNCDCNGNYECRGGTYTCTQRGCTNSCSGCVIEGKSYQGNTRFDIFYNAYGIDMTCECECGGSYKCKGTRDRGGCQQPTCATQTGCQSCQINNVVYRGGSSFQTQIDDQTMSCRCSCNGGYRCQGDQRRTISTNKPEPQTRRTVVAIRPSGYGTTRVRSKTRTYGDSNVIQSQTYQPTSDRVSTAQQLYLKDENTTPRRKECQPSNRKTRFTYEKECQRYSCRCFKNGNYKCDPKKTKKVC